MKVVLSIKPEFASKIFEGTKRFEYRRLIFKNKAVSTVVVYASSPISKVIGEFEINHIIENELEELWNVTKDFSGISKTYFDQYFKGKEKGFGIAIKNPCLYKKPQSIQEDYGMVAPQSFAYL